MYVLCMSHDRESIHASKQQVAKLDITGKESELMGNIMDDKMVSDHGCCII